MVGRPNNTLSPGQVKGLTGQRRLLHKAIGSIVPTIKFGDPDALEDYEGGRDYDSLKTFAGENLKPACSPANIDLCDDKEKAEIEKFQALPDDELESMIAEKEQLIDDAEATFDERVEDLQEKYEQYMQEKEAAIAAVKNSGLKLLKAVMAAKTAGAKKEEL